MRLDPDIPVSAFLAEFHRDLYGFSRRILSLAHAGGANLESYVSMTHYLGCRYDDFTPKIGNESIRRSVVELSNPHVDSSVSTLFFRVGPIPLIVLNGSVECEALGGNWSNYQPRDVSRVYVPAGQLTLLTPKDVHWRAGVKDEEKLPAGETGSGVRHTFHFFLSPRFKPELLS